jgi:hypothetical protein
MSVVSSQILGARTYSEIKLIDRTGATCIDRIVATCMSIAITSHVTNDPSNLRAPAYHRSAINNNGKWAKISKHAKTADALKNSDARNTSDANSVANTKNVWPLNEVQTEHDTLRRIRRTKIRVAKVDDVSHTE